MNEKIFDSLATSPRASPAPRPVPTPPEASAQAATRADPTNVTADYGTELTFALLITRNNDDRNRNQCASPFYGIGAFFPKLEESHLRSFSSNTPSCWTGSWPSAIACSNSSTSSQRRCGDSRIACRIVAEEPESCAEAASSSGASRSSAICSTLFCCAAASQARRCAKASGSSIVSCCIVIPFFRVVIEINFCALTATGKLDVA